SIAAGELVLAQGVKELRGFGSVALSGADTVRGVGSGTLFVRDAAPLVALDAGRMTTAAGADQAIVLRSNPILANADRTRAAADAAVLAGTLRISSTKPAPAAPLEAGGRLPLEAGAIEQRGRIEVPAGVVALRAAAGGLALAASSYTAAPAFAKSFFGTEAFASAGSLSLESTGAISIAEGAVLDVSAAAGGEAGEI